MLKIRIQQNEQKSSRKLPGVFEVRRVIEAGLTRRMACNRDLMIFQGMLEVKTTARLQVNRQGIKDGLPGAGLLPVVIALVAGLPGRRSGGNVIPRLVGGELPEDGLEDGAVIEGRTTTGDRRSEERL